MNNVHVHFEAGAEHANGIGDVVLAVHKEMLADGVNDAVFRGQVDGLGIFNNVLDVFFGNFAIGADDGVNAAIVKAANVAARDAKENAADFDVGHLLGFDDGVAHIFLGGGDVGDFTFADAARTALAETDEVEAAFRSN